jgi:TolB-like protein
VEKVRHYSPGATIASVMQVMAIEPEALRSRFAEGLRRAGLPDGETIADARPTIAVLPFLAVGPEGEEGNLADGLAEDIITDLSRVSGLFVVARHAVAVYRGKPVRAQQAAKELGVRYLLEGSVRAAGGGVRITVQLIDGKTEGQVWAERYDRALTDILALQDEIARNVAEALKVRLLPEELAAIARRPTANAEAYQYYLLGRSFFLRSGWGQRAMKVARQMFEKALPSTGAMPAPTPRSPTAIPTCCAWAIPRPRSRPSSPNARWRWSWSPTSPTRMPPRASPCSPRAAPPRPRPNWIAP